VTKRNFDKDFALCMLMSTIIRFNLQGDDDTIYMIADACLLYEHYNFVPSTESMDTYENK